MAIQWRAALRRVVDGRPVLLAGATPAAWGAVVPLLLDAGVSDVMVVSTESRGAGAAPDCHVVIVEPEHDGSMLGRLRAGVAVLRSLPDDVVAEIDRFDPGRKAVVFGTFLSDVAVIAGRPVFAHRRPEWVQLEDKTLVDAFWDRAGVARKPSVVVPLEDAWAASGALDEGDGTVWVADATEGFNGGAAMVRWVADRSDAQAARAHLAGHCSTVRVMPFVEGIPCSIHGWVLPDGTAVLRPVEMVTLRDVHRLVYAGCASFWDPEPWVREQMRDVARRAGEQLRAEVGFRSAFTVDGVVGRDGFWPTELNPRFGAGLNVISRGLVDLPLTVVHDLVVAGEDLGVTAAAFEQEVLTAADATRSGGTWRVVQHADPVAVERPDLMAGNGFVRFGFDPATTPVGPSVASMACERWAWAAEHLGTGDPPFTPAPDLR
jgi:hypothetical protein